MKVQIGGDTAVEAEPRDGAMTGVGMLGASQLQGSTHFTSTDLPGAATTNCRAMLYVQLFEIPRFACLQILPLALVADRVGSLVEPAYVIRNISFTDTQVFCAPGMHDYLRRVIGTAGTTDGRAYLYCMSVKNIAYG
jgi:hypothetical protein